MNAEEEETLAEIGIGKATKWRFRCNNIACKYEGTAGELLSIREDLALRCPVCKTANWEWR